MLWEFFRAFFKLMFATIALLLSCADGGIKAARWTMEKIAPR